MWVQVTDLNEYYMYLVPNGGSTLFPIRFIPDLNIEFTIF